MPTSLDATKRLFRASLATLASVELRLRESHVRLVTMVTAVILRISWYLSIFAGFFTLQCPVLYLIFINHKLYRKVMDFLFVLCSLYPVAIFQCCFNTHLHHFGDYVNPHESSILILNHRTRVDWIYIWIALYHATQGSVEETRSCRHDTDEKRDMLDVRESAIVKFVLKDYFKLFPGLGWTAQLNFCLFVKQTWREDQVSITQYSDYFTRLKYPYPCCLIMFPEGTNLTEENLRKSHKFADANCLPHYEHVLQPRTTGWAGLCSRMRGAGLASVYDVTIAYDTPAQNEFDLLLGNIPHHVYVHFKRYPIGQLPYGEDALKSWMNDRWTDKENSLHMFDFDGTFIDPTTDRVPPERAPRKLFTAKLGIIFWTIVDIIFIYLLIRSMLFQSWVLYHCILFSFVTFYFGGLQNIEYKLIQNKFSLT